MPLTTHELLTGTVERTCDVACHRDRIYYDAPGHIHKRGFGSFTSTGDVGERTPQYRMTIARQCYAYIETHPVDFSATEYGVASSYPPTAKSILGAAFAVTDPTHLIQRPHFVSSLCNASSNA